MKGHDQFEEAQATSLQVAQLSAAANTKQWAKRRAGTEVAKDGEWNVCKMTGNEKGRDIQFIRSLGTTLKLLAHPGSSTSNPVFALIVAENEIVVLEIVDNTINTTVSVDPLHTLLGSGTKVATSIISILAGGSGQCSLGLEQSHAETSRAEDVNNLLNNFSCLPSVLACGDVGLEGGERALGLRGNVDGEVMAGLGNSSIGTGDSGHNTVGGEAAR